MEVHPKWENLVDIFHSAKSGRTYQIIRYLGNGVYGSVYEIRDTANDNRYAAKFYNPNDRNKSFERERDAHEVLSMSPDCARYILCMIEALQIKIDQPQVLRATDFLSGKRISTKTVEVKVLITELMDGDIDDLHVPDEYIEDLIAMTMDGLNHIFAAKLAHRDIKPENILYSGENVVYKIADLGSVCMDRNNIVSTSIIRTPCQFRGTPAFMPPEAVSQLSELATLKEAQGIDIWGLGLTFYTTIFKYPIDLNACGNDLSCITSLTPEIIRTWFPINLIYNRTYPENHSPSSVIGLLRRMIRFSLEQRWPLEELIDYWHRTSYINRSQITLPDFTPNKDCDIETQLLRTEEIDNLCFQLSSLIVIEGELNYSRRLRDDPDYRKQELLDIGGDIDIVVEIITGTLEEGCFDASVLLLYLNNYWTQIEINLDQDWVFQTHKSIHDIEVMECTVQYLSHILTQLSPP